MSSRKVATSWRDAYEVYAAIFWFAGALISLLMGVYGSYGVRFMLLTTLPMILFGCYRAYQAFSLLNTRALLFALSDISISLEDVIKWQINNPGKVWYGKGFYWDTGHTQKLYDFNETIEDDIKPPAFYMWAREVLGLDASKKVRELMKGKPYLHGLEKNEQDIILGLDHRYSHESIGGTTGSGKGRKLAFDVIQSIVRGEGIVVIDPKTDDNLLDLINATLIILDKEDKLNYFSHAFPSHSCRIDPFKNFTQVTELSQRVMSIIGGDSSDAFYNFAWKAVNTVLQGMNQARVDMTLVNLLKYLESEIDDLLILVGTDYLRKYPEAKRIIGMLKDDTKTKQKKAGLIAAGYEELLSEKHPNATLNTIISIFRQERDHYKKLYQNIIPSLIQLTSGSIKDLLSPSKLTDDPRKIVDIKAIAHKGDVLYINLNSLRDKTVGNAIGSLILADIISVISDRYLCYEQDELIPFNVYGDESSDYVSDAAVNLANKSRGSKSCFKFYFQSVTDIAVRLGDDNKADQMLGNTNTTTTLRSESPDSMEKYSSQLKLTTIKRRTEGVTTQTSTSVTETDFNTGYNKSSMKVEVALVPPQDIGQLMDLHSFTRFPGGQLAKLRVPYIPVPSEMKFKLVSVKDDQFGEIIDVAKLIANPNEEIKMQVKQEQIN
jgi:conjugal transfer pilus assembly protein TraD